MSSHEFWSLVPNECTICPYAHREREVHMGLWLGNNTHPSHKARKAMQLSSIVWPQSKHRLGQSSRPHAPDPQRKPGDCCVADRVQSSQPASLANSRNTWCLGPCPMELETCSAHTASCSLAFQKFRTMKCEEFPPRVKISICRFSVHTNR